MLTARQSQPSAKSLDHFVLLVRDADAAAAVYERLGFHVRPLAEHKDVGSRNRVVHFGTTYLEFIDFEGAREDVAGPYRDRFQLGEGLVHVSLTSERLEDDQEILRDRGLRPHPIFSARRAITLPDGSEGETASRCFYLWREDNRYLSLFFSDHPKPDMIFIPEFVNHDNGAREVTRCVYMSTVLEADRDYFSKCFGALPTEQSEERLAWRGPRGDLTEVLSVEAAKERYGDLLQVQTLAPFAGIGIALHYAVDNLAQCRATLEARGVASRDLSDTAIGVAASDAVGCVALFEEFESVFQGSAG